MDGGRKISTSAREMPGLSPDIGYRARFSERLSRISNYEALNVELAARFGRHSFSEVAKLLDANDVPYAPINTLDEVVADPQVVHLGLMVPVESPHGAQQAVRPPVQFFGARSHSVQAAPLLNEHGAQIRADLATDSGWPDARSGAAPAANESARLPASNSAPMA
jgi:crotonobetainyl-CoA:carnitine CoA-transferase CaiB-like acyl-CoA transferase